jgi:hypothetical protein
MKRVAKSAKDVRFPCIHKRDGVDFHFLYMSPSKNHIAVPSCWARWATLWFVEGSGEGSHLRRSCRDSFPVRATKLLGQKRSKTRR